MRTAVLFVRGVVVHDRKRAFVALFVGVHRALAPVGAAFDVVIAGDVFGERVRAEGATPRIQPFHLGEQRIDVGLARSVGDYTIRVTM